jgi:hypothetical protein
MKQLRGSRSQAIQQDALDAALQIVEERIAACRQTEADWATRRPDDTLGQATERAARMEAELIAERIRALSATEVRSAPWKLPEPRRPNCRRSATGLLVASTG